MEILKHLGRHLLSGSSLRPAAGAES
jgi:hypothetical protein